MLISNIFTSNHYSFLFAGDSSIIASTASQASQHVSVTSCVLPNCWDKTLFNTHKAKRPWLTCREGQLGCLACEKVTHLSAAQKQGSGVNISKEWARCNITANGSNRKSQLSSLRKKMHEHENSAAHKAAMALWVFICLGKVLKLHLVVT